MFDFSWFNDPGAWTALATLSLLEIILGIDNIVFISVLVDRLPEKQRAFGRTVGLALAMVTRLMLLAAMKWIMGLQAILFSIPIHPALWKLSPEVASHHGLLTITGKGLILLLGGFFLIWKSTHEIHQGIEHSNQPKVTPKASSLAAVLVQIALIDIIFSLDSVITATGMADHLSVMAMAIVISMAVMMTAAGTISSFVSRHPSIKMLALSFLILIGTALIAEGLHFSIPKGYIYFAMAFSLAVEMLNLRVRSRTKAA